MVEPHRAGRSFEELATEFGCTSWSMRQWVKHADRDGGRGDGGLTSAEREELTRLRREKRKFLQERDILSKAAAWFANEKPATPKRSSESWASSTVYCYDANGNMTRRGASTNTIGWTSYNYPSAIVNSSTENIGFLYGPDRQRWRTQYVNGATTETTYHVGNAFQKVITGSTTDYRHYIYVGARAIAVSVVIQ